MRKKVAGIATLISTKQQIVNAHFLSSDLLHHITELLRRKSAWLAY